MKLLKFMVLIMALTILLVPLITQSMNKPLMLTSAQPKPFSKITNICLGCTGCCLGIAISPCIIANGCIKLCCPNQHQEISKKFQGYAPSAPQTASMDSHN